jgi:hypothetical protein
VPSPSSDERGAITAEWVITLPALAMVAAFLASGLGVGVSQQHLHSDASDQARVLGLGGDPAGLVVTSAPRRTTRSYPPELVCVHLSEVHDTGLWSLAPLELVATACALDTRPQSERLKAGRDE